MCLCIFVLQKGDFAASWWRRHSTGQLPSREGVWVQKKRCWSNQVYHFALPWSFLCAHTSQKLGVIQQVFISLVGFLHLHACLASLTPHWLRYKIFSAGPILAKFLNSFSTLETSVRMVPLISVFLCHQPALAILSKASGKNFLYTVSQVERWQKKCIKKSAFICQ